MVGCSVYEGLSQPQPMLYTSTCALTPAVLDHSITFESSGFLASVPCQPSVAAARIDPGRFQAPLSSCSGSQAALECAFTAAIE